MKLITIIFILCVVSTPVFADHVNGYYRSNGTYVHPYERSAPNGTVTDNYSYQGNQNPYTGQVGQNNYTHDMTSPYYQGPDNQGHVGHSTYENYGDSNLERPND